MTEGKHAAPDRLWADPSDANVGEGHCFVTFDFEVASNSVPYVRADIVDDILEALKAIGAPDPVDLVSLPEPVVRGMLNAAVSVAQDAIAKATGEQS